MKHIFLNVHSVNKWFTDFEFYIDLCIYYARSYQFSRPLFQVWLVARDWQSEGISAFVSHVNSREQLIQGLCVFRWWLCTTDHKFAVCIMVIKSHPFSSLVTLVAMKVDMTFFLTSKGDTILLLVAPYL